MCNRYRITEAQIALAARYGVEAPFPPDHTIPPPQLLSNNVAHGVYREGGARYINGGLQNALTRARLDDDPRHQ